MRSYDTFTENDLQTIFVFACYDQTSLVALKKPVMACLKRKQIPGLCDMWRVTCVTREKGLFDLEIFQGVAFSYA